MITKENYIGIDAILTRMNAVPRFVCDGLVFFTTRQKIIDPIMLGKFMQHRHFSEYDDNKSIKENVEAIWGKDLAEQIEYHIKNAVYDVPANVALGGK